MPRLLSLILILFLGLLQPALAETRMALVIGNGAYRTATLTLSGTRKTVGLPALPNPANDAQDLTTALRTLGFEVLLGLDLDKAGMEERLSEFARKARQAEVALIFYSGHGLQHEGVNYLAPVDAFLSDEVDLRRRFIRVDDLIQDLQSAARVRMLILDACRDNDAIRELRASLPASRSGAVRGSFGAQFGWWAQSGR